MSGQNLEEWAKEKGRILQKEIDKLWRIVEKTASKVERVEGDMVTLLVTALKPVCLIKCSKNVTVEEKEEGGFGYVTRYTYRSEVDVARLSGWLYLFIMTKTREAPWEPTQRERYIALVDVESREFKKGFIDWLLNLPFPQVEVEESRGRRVITLTDRMDDKLQVITVRRTRTKLIVHLLTIPDKETVKAYRVV